MITIKQSRWIKFVIFAMILLILLWLSFFGSITDISVAQIPTGEVPTVTSTPRGPYVVIDPIAATDTTINVRAGPSALTERVGVLLMQQEANAIGQYGDWIQIEYPGGPGGKGWIFANLVTLYNGPLPLIEPPPTSTPVMTQTIDPTLAAQFLITPDATRLPTFTEPAPLEIPTYEVDAGSAAFGGVPMGLVIVGLGALGVFLAVIALISGR